MCVLKGKSVTGCRIWGEKIFVQSDDHCDDGYKRPCSIWAILHGRLIPYLQKMKTGTRIYVTNLIGEVNELFDEQEYRNNSSLNSDYLLAYYCQRNELYRKKEKEA